MAEENKEQIAETENNMEATENPAEEQENAESAEDTQESEQTQENTSNSAQKEINDLKDKYMRLYAEFENFKRRTAKEKLEMTLTASKDTISILLPVLDDFERAKKNAEDPNSAEQFSEGVLLVYDKLNKTLKNKGLERMESNGVDFDPEYHEAITEIPAPTEEMKGKVIDTVEAGYFLNDKIIRYAKVVVGK
jgi:molecular chaperone GrpE